MARDVYDDGRSGDRFRATEGAGVDDHHPRKCYHSSCQLDKALALQRD